MKLANPLDGNFQLLEQIISQLLTHFIQQPGKLILGRQTQYAPFARVHIELIHVLLLLVPKNGLQSYEMLVYVSTVWPAIGVSVHIKIQLQTLQQEAPYKSLSSPMYQ